MTDKSVELPKRSDDEDEDIIDLGKDEDLDFEIKNDGKPESRVCILKLAFELEFDN